MDLCGRKIAELTQRGLVCVVVAGLLLSLAPHAPSAGELTDYEQSGAAFEEGRALAERGLHARAIDAYKEAVRLDPTFVEAMVNLARVYVGRGELGNASIWVDRAVRKQPGYPDVYTVRGLIALTEDRPQDALTSFGRARQLAPENVEVLTNLGGALLRLGVLDEARTLLEQALMLDPARPEAALNLAVLWDRGEDPARAVYLYQKFLGLVPSDDPDREPVQKRIASLEIRFLKLLQEEPENSDRDD